MNEKTKRAIGLKYNAGKQDGEKSAPKVVAKGEGALADEIVQLAKSAGVLIHEDPYLVEFLAALDLGQEIPEHLYTIIAEIIAYSYLLQGKRPEGWNQKLGEELTL